MNKIFEVIKANRKAIIKKTLIIGGAVIGLVLVTNAVTKRGGNDLSDDPEYTTVDHDIEDEDHRDI